MSTTLMIKKIDTLPVTVDVAIPPEKPVLKGKFVAHAKVRSKDEIKALGERISSGEFENNDEALLRELYTTFDGLGDAEGPYDADKAWAFILKGQFSAQLTILLLNRYYEAHSEARQGNFARQR